MFPEGMQLFEQAMAFALFVIVVVLLPGRGLISIADFPVGRLSESVVISGAVGISVVAWTSLVVGPASLWLVPLLLLPLGLAGLRAAITDVQGAQVSSRDERILAAAVGLALLTVLPLLSTYTPRDDGVVLTLFGDHLLHTSTAIEVLRGVPPAEMPHLAGIEFWRYHLFTDLLIALPVHLLGLSPIVVQHALTHFLGWTLLFGGVALLGQRLSGSSAGAALALFALLFRPGATFDLLFELDRSTPTLLALVSVVGLMLTLFRARWVDSRAAIIPGLLLGALFSWKANLFLVVAPAVLPFALTSMARGRQHHVAKAALAAALGILPSLIVFFSRGTPRPLAMHYGEFARYLATHYVWLTEIGELDAVGAPLVIAAWFFEIAGPGAGLALGFLAVRFRRPALVPEALVLTLGLGVAWFAVCLFLVEEDTGPFEVWNVAYFSRHLVWVLTAGAAGAGLARLVGWIASQDRLRIPRRAAAMGPVIALVILLLAVSATFVSPRREGALLLPRDFLSAGAFVDRTSPTDAVMLANVNLMGPTINSTITARRQVVERAVLFDAFFPSVVERIADTAVLFSTSSVAQALAILKTYQVDLVLEHAARALRAPVRAALSPLFREGSMTIYAVDAVHIPSHTDGPRLDRDGARRHARLALDVLAGASAEAVAHRAGVSTADVERWLAALRALDGATLAAGVDGERMGSAPTTR